MSNLNTFIALENILKKTGHGKVDLGLNVRAGVITGLTVTGTKKLLYNSSGKDTNNNEKAIRDIAERLLEQLEKNVSSEIVFRVKNVGNQIKTLEIESSQIMKGHHE